MSIQNVQKSHLYLQGDILAEVCQHLLVEDIFGKVARVCKNWKDTIENNKTILTFIYKKYFPNAFLKLTDEKRTLEIFKKTFTIDKNIAKKNFLKKELDWKKGLSFLNLIKLRISDPISKIAILKEESKVFCLTERELRIWDLANGNPLAIRTTCIDGDSYKGDFLNDFQLDNEQKRIYLADGQFLQIHDFNGKRIFSELRRPRVSSENIRQLIIDKEGKLLFGVSGDELLIWEMNGTHKKSLKYSEKAASPIIIDNIRKKFILASSSAMSLYNYEGKLENTCDLHKLTKEDNIDEKDAKRPLTGVYKNLHPKSLLNNKEAIVAISQISFNSMEVSFQVDIWKEKDKLHSCFNVIFPLPKEGGSCVPIAYLDYQFLYLALGETLKIIHLDSVEERTFINLKSVHPLSSMHVFEEWNQVILILKDGSLAIWDILKGTSVVIEDLNASEVEGVFDQDGFKLYIGTSLGDLTVLDFNPKISPSFQFLQMLGSLFTG